MSKFTNVVIGTLEDIMGGILTTTGCGLKWGEVELPESFRAELEDETSVN